MVINKGFCIKLLGDVDLKGMVVIVDYNDQAVAEINYEKGVDHIEIELLSGPEISTFPLNDFFSVLQEAKELAIKCAKEDEELRKKGIDL